MYSFVMPRITEEKVESLIVFWHKSEGDLVKKGDVLVEVQTEKAVSEVEAPVSGRLATINAKRGDVVAEGHVLAVIEEMEEHLGSQKEVAASSSVQEQVTTVKGKPEEKRTNSFVQASPFVRRLAQELKVDLASIQGSGPKGRVTEEDVRAAAGNDVVSGQETIKEQVKPDALALHTGANATPLAKKIADVEGIPLDTIAGTGIQGKVRKADVLSSLEGSDSTQLAQGTDDRIKVEGARRVIAHRMVESAFTAPHVTLVTEVDMSVSIEMRKTLLPVIEKKDGQRLSYTEIIMKAVSHGLMLHPKVNASLQGDYIVLHRDINIGLAVAVPNGLVVPVVKHTNRKGLSDLVEDCKRLVGLARENKLMPDDMSGGTFTISNLGMYAIDAFTPIINQPESAILGVGRIHEKPTGVEGRIELRPMMTLSLSFDHRVIDGAPAAEFLQTVKDVLENPYQLIV
nr:2-oxo acid dehydrogenase subunit E2 [Aneurinibacillus terranovensis]